ncbi:recombinase family protein [Emticicia sp. BO119]|uniref:recombinase family protein n=1 Tax=Emticicia sp. BO119 TaxID=2757768 RepID=UPI0015F0DB3E|nr:recombinase family protein [Emticicia sp. BO119]MBA4850476.1 recombinase family protein [Emticicia sp. BO119]
MNADLLYFIYCRKSSEDSSRQIASISDQINALEHIIQREALSVVKVFTEERSAKDPDRPVFNEMLGRINKGEANAILCWDIDRLSRNPIDTGQLQWKLQKGVIKVIKTPSRTFYPDDAGLLLSIEGGRATDYVVKLSKNVKRGMYGRATKGWRPIIAPIGYINAGLEKGNKTIEPDPERFEIIRKMWHLLLSGGYTVAEILNIATHEYGLRSLKRRKIGGTPITKGYLYEIFKQPFYYGYFNWKDAETGMSRLMKGNHTPMISEFDYWRAQKLLGRRGKPQPKVREFAYTGLLKCGECNSAIVGEDKYQVRCTECRFKFSCLNQTSCPCCKIDILAMKGAKIRHYVYYRCTKKKNPRCSQKGIKVEDLETQFLTNLEAIHIDEPTLNLILAYIEKKHSNSANELLSIKKSLQSAYDDSQKRLANLTREYVSVLNSNYDLFTEHEFLAQKKAIRAEIDTLTRRLDSISEGQEDTHNQLKRFFKFCTHAKEHFIKGDLRVKRMMISSLGLNQRLINKKVDFICHNPFLQVEEMKNQQYTKLVLVEPEDTLMIKEPKPIYRVSIPELCSTVDTVRTFLRENKDIEIADLDSLSKEGDSS